MLALIIQASQETVSIALPSKGMAVQLRQRLHSFRKRLRKDAEKPTAGETEKANSLIAETVETALLILPDGQVFLIVRPRDSLFLQAIRDAGVNVDAKDVTEEATAATLTTIDPASAMEHYLNPTDLPKDRK